MAEPDEPAPGWQGRARLIREGNGTAFVLMRVAATDPPKFKRNLDPSACRGRFRAALTGDIKLELTNVAQNPAGSPAPTAKHRKTKKEECRDRYNLIGGCLGFFLAIVSLGIGIYSLRAGHPPALRSVGIAIIGLWAVLPPIFFWLDWVVFFEHGNSQSMVDEVTKQRRDIAKHSHDLARNIWLGLLVVLYALFEFKIPGM